VLKPRELSRDIEAMIWPSRFGGREDHAVGAARGEVDGAGLDACPRLSSREPHRVEGVGLP